jgi:hypothetical protein
MSSSTVTEFERVTVEEVQVGDRIARTRNDTFHAVESIDEGPTTRRLHFAREACPEPELKDAPSGGGWRYCPACHRSTDSEGVTLAGGDGHGTIGGGNIRPRRTAKLWKIKG